MYYARALLNAHYNKWQVVSVTSCGLVVVGEQWLLQLLLLDAHYPVFALTQIRSSGSQNAQLTVN